MVLAVVEHADGEPADLSLQALAFARTLGEPVEAVLVGGEEAARRVDVPVAYVVDISGSYAPGAWAAAVIELVERRSPSAVIAAGSEVGNEVLAHVAARLDLPFAANCVEATPGDPLLVTRARWGGSLL